MELEVFRECRVLGWRDESRKAWEPLETLLQEQGSRERSWWDLWGLCPCLEFLRTSGQPQLWDSLCEGWQRGATVGKCSLGSLQWFTPALLLCIVSGGSASAVWQKQDCPALTRQQSECSPGLKTTRHRAVELPASSMWKTHCQGECGPRPFTCFKGQRRWLPNQGKQAGTCSSKSSFWPKRRQKLAEPEVHGFCFRPIWLLHPYLLARWRASVLLT